MNINIYKEKIMAGEDLTKEEILTLCATTDKEALYALANEVREHFTGNRFDTCSIINAKSGRCSEDCKWCSQSAFHQTNADVYALIPASEAVAMARHNADKGIKKFSLVTSGKRISGKEVDAVCDIYRELGKEVDIELCASLGLVDKEVMRKLKESGVKNYHCNLETSPRFFKTLCTTHTIEEKLETLKAAKEAGLNTCSGGIMGMGENFEDRVEWALTLRELGVKSIPLNILNPIKGTKLEGVAPLSDEEVLTTFAMFRLVNPRAMIRFAGGRLQIAHIQEKALQAGVNAALMGDLLTTIGSQIDEDKKMIKKLGFLI